MRTYWIASGLRMWTPRTQAERDELRTSPGSGRQPEGWREEAWGLVWRKRGTCSVSVGEGVRGGGE